MDGSGGGGGGALSVNVWVTDTLPNTLVYPIHTLTGPLAPLRSSVCAASGCSCPLGVPFSTALHVHVARRLPNSQSVVHEPYRRVQAHEVAP